MAKPAHTPDCPCERCRRRREAQPAHGQALIRRALDKAGPGDPPRIVGHVQVLGDGTLQVAIQGTLIYSALLEQFAWSQVFAHPRL